MAQPERAKRKRRRKSNAGLTRWRQAVSTIIPKSSDYFSEQVKKLGLDPAKTTTFEWLEVDDKVSHQQQAA